MSIGKILGAVVVAIVLVVAVNVFGDLVYDAGAPPEVQTAQTQSGPSDEAPAATGTEETAAESAGGEDAAETPASEPQIAGLIGDPEAGKKVSRQCAACHTFDEGGPNRVGPNLWNVVGSDIAAHDGFNYSDALAGVEGDWTLEHLQAWVGNPKEFAPGNKMTFAGLKGDDLTNMIAYLQTLQPEDEIGKLGPQDDGGDAAEAEEASGEEQAAAADDAAADESAAPAEEGGEEAAAEAPAEDAAAPAEGDGETQTAAVAGDPAAGEKAMRVCAACHTWNEGGSHRVGPNLYGTFGADVAGHEGFSYSKALQGVEGEWTADKLDAWLTNPREFAPGNKMTFAGVKDETDRQNIIAFLAQQR